MISQFMFLTEPTLSFLWLGGKYSSVSEGVVLPFGASNDGCNRTGGTGLVGDAWDRVNGGGGENGANGDAGDINGGCGGGDDGANRGQNGANSEGDGVGRGGDDDVAISECDNVASGGAVDGASGGDEKVECSGEVANRVGGDCSSSVTSSSIGLLNVCNINTSS
jgi:hypothetical protein